MGDEDKICVDEESEGGVNVSVSTWPRCIRAVRLSDAFCLRITRLDIPDSLFGVCGTAVGGLVSGDPWKEEEERAHVCIGNKNKEAVEAITRRMALILMAK